MSPSVCIILPTCNRPVFLRRAIDSVLSQSYSNWELIVVDDGTEQSGEAVITACADARVVYLKNNKSLGAGGSRNVGVSKARAPLIAFLDDDDVWTSDKLRKQLAVFEMFPEVVYSFSAVVVRFRDRTHRTTVPQGLGNYHERALTRFSGTLTSTLMMRTEAFRASGGFDESLPSHQEAELMIRVSQLGTGFGINEPLTSMDSSGHQHIGASLERRIKGRELLLKKHAEKYKTLPYVYAKHVREIGFWHRDRGDMLAARNAFKDALQISVSLRTLLHIMRTYLPY